tara:strand:+ start:1353 stop:1586 length:234 start_codon:yes stop_codon:yes gene_type:complete
MNKVNPTLKDLFKQLGLPNQDADIQSFIELHKPLSETMKLHQAPCWSAAQSAFLEEVISNDGDWSYLADELDTLLRK